VAKKTKQYTAAFRANAVRMAEESKAPLTRVARDLEVSYQTLYGWVSKAGTARKSREARPGAQETVEEELRRLRRELDEVTMERDFAKKAAAFFAKMNK